MTKFNINWESFPQESSIIQRHIDKLMEWSAKLPILPAGFQYRFESKGFDLTNFSDQLDLTILAIPEKIHYFEED